MATIRATGRFIAGAVLMLCIVALTAGTADAQEISNEAKILLLQSKSKATSILQAAGKSDSGRERLAALEGSQFAPDVAFEMARNGLSDENPAVRFGALVTIGKLEFRGLADAAVDLMKDDNESVRAAALFAAKKCGRDVDLSPLAGMLANGSSGARANAAMLVGQLGDAQAIEMLRDMADQPMPRVNAAERSWVRLQYAEAMIRLDPNDAEVLGSIRASVYSNLDDVRILAIQILGEVGDRSVQGGLAHIVKRDNPIQVKIAAAQSLVRMGDQRAAGTLFQATRYDERQLRTDLQDYLRKNNVAGSEALIIQDLLSDEAARKSTAGEVRAQAAIALGYVDSVDAAKRLIALLEDPDAMVRIAASTSILRALR
jgi:HEAT repeat protein